MRPTLALCCGLRVLRLGSIGISGARAEDICLTSTTRLILRMYFGSRGGVWDPVVLAAALLHDTIEDTQTSLQEPQGEFGEQVARIVMEVTDERSLHWRARKKLQVSQARLASPAARQVKLADKICNLRSMISAPPNGWSIDRQRAYFDWAKDVVDQLRGANPELEARFDQVHKKRP